MVSRFFAIVFETAAKTALAVIFSLAASLLLLSIGEAKAVGSGADSGSHADAIVKLLANPGSIFSGADGKPLTVPGLVSNVRDLTIADKAALQPIIGALKLAATEEKSAIGTGLGQAALAVIKTDPAYAAEIQEALAATTDQGAILAFAAVTGNVPTGAVGGGAGGAAGGGAGGSSVAGGPAGGTGGAGSAGAGGGGTTNAFVVSTAGLTVNITTATATAAAATTAVTTTITTTTAVSNALTGVSP